MIHRWVCSILLPVLLLTSLGAPTNALASNRFVGTLTPKSQPEITITDDCPTKMNLARFRSLIAQYPAIYHDPRQGLRQWDLEDQITNAVFCAAGTPNYVAYLQAVASDSSQDQKAYYNLARRLQAHWETRYALGLAKLQHARMQKVADLSWKLSLLVTAIGFFGKVSQVPTYFYIVRQLFPVLLPGMAVGGAHFVNKYHLFDGKYPLSPAHIMDLPLPQANTKYDTYDIIRNVTGATAYVAGAQLAVSAVKYFKLGMTIGKTSFNPVTIIASLVVGQVAQNAAQDALDAYQYHRLTSKLFLYRDELTGAIRDKNYMAMRTAAENFKNAAIMLSAFLDRQSLNVWVNYEKAIHSAKSDPPWKTYAGTALLMWLGASPTYFFPTPAYETHEIAKARKNRDLELEAIEAAQDPLALQDVRLAIALNVMREGLDNVSLLDGEEKTEAEIIREGFELSIQGKKLSPAQSSAAYSSYIDALSRQKDRMLAQELLQGNIRRNPSHILLQAAAFVRSLNQPLLQSVSDDLLNIVYSGELLQ